MTEQQHPITPPSEQDVKKWWAEEEAYVHPINETFLECVAIKAAQWGWKQRDSTVPQELQKRADQELEACCAEIKNTWGYEGSADYLRAARRPKMTTDFRALCVELVNELHGYKVAHPNHDTDLIDRVRTELAEPKPPSLKEQALEALNSFEGFTGSLEEVDIIRRALESLPEQ